MRIPMSASTPTGSQWRLISGPFYLMLPDSAVMRRRSVSMEMAGIGRVPVLTGEAFSCYSLPRVRRESVADMVGSEPAIGCWLVACCHLCK